MTTIPIDITKEELEGQVKELLKRASDINQEIRDSNLRFKNEIDAIKEKAGASVGKIEQLFSEVDQLEKETGDELDKLMLEQSEVLADDSDEGEDVDDEDAEGLE